MNPDQALVRRFAADPSRPLAVETNPLAASLRAELLRLADGRLEMAFAPGAEFLQGAQVIQGGVVGAMLDFAMGFVVMATLPEGLTTATAQLAVSYFKPVLAGRCTVAAEIERSGRTLAFTRATLRDASGTVLATATSVCSIFAAREPS